jgi:hypothetical protein
MARRIHLPASRSCVSSDVFPSREAFTPITPRNHHMNSQAFKIASSTRGSAPAVKISVSLPRQISEFLEKQCDAFAIGPSGYVQMILEAERHGPRKEFVIRTRDISGGREV